jgi:indolepyruvate ferredoxin oxidoreductase
VSPAPVIRLRPKPSTSASPAAPKNSPPTRTPPTPAATPTSSPASAPPKPLGSERLTDAVARNYFKLLAYKDEYEVARLFADPAFRAGLDARFEGDFQLRFHLAPTFLARPDPDSGRIRKLAFGPWMLTAFKWLARLRRLRGTPFDIFGYHPERKAERALVVEYEQDIVLLLAGLDAGRLPWQWKLPACPRGSGAMVM